MDEMMKSLGATMVLSPNAGAGGLIGTNKALQAKPDGYTLLLTTEGSMVSLVGLRNVRFGLDDWVSIGSYATGPLSLCINASESRFKTLEEFIAYAKENKGKVSIGITGKLSINHIAAALLIEAYGLDVRLVPFDGALQVVGAVGSGHIDAGISEMLYNTSIKGIAMYSKERNPNFPDIPTFTEKGYPQVNWGNHFALYASSKIPKESVTVLREAMTKAVNSPTSLDTLQKLHFNTIFLSGDELDALMRDRVAQLNKLVEKGVIEPEKQ
ncbi:Bug family tripartite tricarboxylate transporter substrate binding protein [Desulfovibrio litoralis]|nr:tripartite tricarboxylate transporter substrate binding protein [Desulfovibrio litoralis]